MSIDQHPVLDEWDRLIQRRDRRLRLAGVLVLAALVAGFLTGCANPVGPTYGIPNAVPVAAPQADRIMDALWDTVQTCSGVHTADSWRRITWYVVHADSFEYAPGRSAIGLWTAAHHIYLADARLTWDVKYAVSDTLLFRSTIKHEMIHDLTQSPEHGPAFPACHLGYGPTTP